MLELQPPHTLGLYSALSKQCFLYRVPSTKHFLCGLLEALRISQPIITVYTDKYIIAFESFCENGTYGSIQELSKKAR